MASAPPVYADATSLIALARIGRLDLLALLPTPILVTDAVWREVVGDLKRAGVPGLLKAHADGLLRVVEEGDAGALPQVDAGESTVLTAAARVGASVLVDERKARALAGSHPALVGKIRSCFGVIGLILLAKHRGDITAVRPLLDELIAQSFWMSTNLYESVLAHAGES